MGRKVSIDWIVRRAAGRLGAREQALLDAALAADAELARLAGQQNAVWRALEDWEGEPISADFDARLYARIELLDTAAWWPRLLRTVRWSAALPLALASLALVGGLLLSHGKKRSVAVAPVEAMSAREADQIENTLDDLQTLRQLSADEAASQL